MTSRIQIIGLGRQRPVSELWELIADAAIVARNSRIASQWLDGAAPLYAVLDDVFDRTSIHEIGAAVLERVDLAVKHSGRCVYLVPEVASLGDSTVEEIVSTRTAGIVPGAVDVPGAHGAVQIVDALALAVAESRVPFDAGLVGIDPTKSLIVTNVYGTGVKGMVEQRITRLFGEQSFALTDAGTLVIHPNAEPGAISSLEGLEQIIARLRSPEGCPWDREQTLETLLPMMVDEVDELREAIVTGSGAEQADELGDVLLHIVMLAQIGRETGQFTREAAVRNISAKMVRRHPHVFGDVELSRIEDLYSIWQSVKAAERAEREAEQAPDQEG